MYINEGKKKIQAGYEAGKNSNLDMKARKKIKPGYEGKKKSNLNLKARKNQTWM